MPAEAEVAHPALRPRLYHYTTAEGVFGIIESESIWATRIQHLNDAKELRHAFDVIRERLQVLRQDAAPARAALLDAMTEHIGQMNEINVFVFSLSAEGDLLSQWRAYCPDGGYAIEFDRERLVTLANAHGCRLAPCVYEPAEQRRIIADCVDTYLAKREGNLLERDPTKEKELFRQAGNEFAHRMVRNVAPFLKDPSFAEEREWRLVSPPTDMFNEHIGHRTRRGRIVPYLALRIDRRQHISGVIIGPSHNIVLAEDGLISYIVKRGGKAWPRWECGMRRSRSPYRGTS